MLACDLCPALPAIKTKLMQLKLITSVTCMFVIVVLLGSPAQAGRKAPLNSTPPEISNSTLCSASDAEADEDIELKTKREDFCKLTNSIRVWHLFHTLTLDSDLNEIAQHEAKVLYDTEKKNITTDEEDETDFNQSTLLEKIRDAGIEVGTLGFHISTSGLSEAHDVIRSSLSNPTPRKKLLGKSYRKVGIGFYRGVWISLFTD